ncbi:MAG: CsiV family protein, partial [Gammaproteobacteria bacterium]
TELGPGSFRLRADAAALKRSGRYQPILHLAWRQAPVPLNAGHAVHVHGPGNSDTVNGTVKLSEGRYLHLSIDLLYYPAGGPPGPDASTPGTNDNGPSTPNQAGNDGTAPGDNPADGAAAPTAPGDTGNADSAQTAVPAPKVWVSNPDVFRLHQERKLRTGRVQYFDQPHFGVLALVTPYTPPKPKPQAPADHSGDSAPTDGTSAPANGN